MSIYSAKAPHIKNFIKLCESVAKEEDTQNTCANRHISSIVEKCTAMLNATESSNYEQIEVEYEKKGSCCLIGCKSICSFWSFCRRVNCFGITHNYYTATTYSGRVVLHPKTSFHPPTPQQSRITNASFFLELHNTLGVYLIPAWKLSVVYIEDHFSKEDAAYWESWDPLSQQYTPRDQIDFFREIITDAATTIKKTRRQTMRGYLTREDEENVGPQRRRGRSVGQVSLLSMEMERFYLKEKDTLEKEDLYSVAQQLQSEMHKKRVIDKSLSIDSLSLEYQSSKGSSSTEEFHTPPEQEEWLTLDKEPDVARGIYEPAESPPSSPKGRAVVFEEGRLSFDRGGIIGDVLALTLARQRQAEEIVNELEKELAFPYSVKQKWEAIKKLVEIKGIKLRDLKDSEDSEELPQSVMNDFYLRDESHLRKMEDIIVQEIQEKRIKNKSGCFTFCNQ